MVHRKHCLPNNLYYSFSLVSQLKQKMSWVNQTMSDDLLSWGVWIIISNEKSKQSVNNPLFRNTIKSVHKTTLFTQHHAWTCFCIPKPCMYIVSTDRPESHILQLSSCRYSFQQGIYRYLSHCSYLRDRDFFFSLAHEPQQSVFYHNTSSDISDSVWMDEHSSQTESKKIPEKSRKRNSLIQKRRC